MNIRRATLSKLTGIDINGMSGMNGMRPPPVPPSVLAKVVNNGKTANRSNLMNYVFGIDTGVSSMNPMMPMASMGAAKNVNSNDTSIQTVKDETVNENDDIVPASLG